MFIDFRSICFIEEHSKTFLAKSSNTGEEVLTTNMQIAKFKAAFRTLETKNGKIHCYFEVEFKFWNDC